MRKVEKMMVEAIKAGKPMKSGNTEVVQLPELKSTEVYLYGHKIAFKLKALAVGTHVLPELGWRWSLADHNTRTTRSRINALSAGLGWGFTIGNVKGIPTVRYHNYTGPRSPVFQVTDTEWVEA